MLEEEEIVGKELDLLKEKRLSKAGLTESQIKIFMDKRDKLKIPPNVHYGFEAKKQLSLECYFRLYLPDNQNIISELKISTENTDKNLDKQKLRERVTKMFLSYIKRNLPLPQLFEDLQTKISEIHHINLWSKDFRLVWYSILNEADPKLRMFLLKDFSKNNCIPLVHPTWDTDIKTTKNRTMIELLPLISASHVITSIGIGDLSKKSFGKTVFLNSIFETSFGNNGKSQSLFIGGGSIEIFFDVFRGVYEPVSIIDIEHDADERIISSVIQMTNILIIHANENDKIPEEYRAIPNILIIRNPSDLNPNSQDLNIKISDKKLEIRLPLNTEIPHLIKEKVITFVTNYVDNKQNPPKATRANFFRLFCNPADNPHMIKLTKEFEDQIQAYKEMLATDKFLSFLPLVRDMSENKKRIKLLEQSNSMKTVAKINEENMKIIQLLKNKEKLGLKKGIINFADIITQSQCPEMEIDSINKFLKNFYKNEAYHYVLHYNGLNTQVPNLLLVKNKEKYEEFKINMLKAIEENMDPAILSAHCPFYATKKINFPNDWTEMKKQLGTSLDNLKLQISNRSLTIESIWREIAYFYQYQKDNSEGFKKIIKCYTNYIERGGPFEIIDGDNYKMPEAFLKAVFSEFAEQRILVISVIGPQSSGKSTLLNFLFGCDFLTSTGRCTKGIYGSFVKLDDSNKELRKHYDAFLILDTEGLMAIHKSEETGFDKKIGLFCLAVSQLVIINVRGDIHRDMKDLLSSCAASLHELRVEKVPSPSIQIVLNQNSDKNKENHMSDINQILTEIQEFQSCTNEEKPIIDISAENVYVLPQAFENKSFEIESKKKEVPISHSLKGFADEIQKFQIGIIKNAIKYNTDNPKTGFNIIESWLKNAKTIWRTINTFDSLISYSSIKEYQDYNKLMNFILDLCSRKGGEFRKRWEEKKEDLEGINTTRITIEEECVKVINNLHEFQEKIKLEYENKAGIKSINAGAKCRADSLLLSEFTLLENEIKDDIADLKRIIDQRDSEVKGNKLLHDKALELQNSKKSQNDLKLDFEKYWAINLSDFGKAYNVGERIKSIYDKITKYFSEECTMERYNKRIEDFFISGKFNKKALTNIETLWTIEDVKESFFANTIKLFNYYDYAKVNNVEYLNVLKNLDNDFVFFDIPKEFFVIECLNWNEIEKDCQANIENGINKVRETLFNIGFNISNFALSKLYMSKDKSGKRTIPEEIKESITKELYRGKEMPNYQNYMNCKYLISPEKLDTFKMTINMLKGPNYNISNETQVYVLKTDVIKCKELVKKRDLIEKIIHKKEDTNIKEKLELMKDKEYGVNFEKIKEDIQKLVDKYIIYEGKMAPLNGALVYKIVNSMQTLMLRTINMKEEDKNNLMEERSEITFFKNLNKCLAQINVMLSNEGQSYYLSYCAFCIWKKYAIAMLNAYGEEKKKIKQQKDAQLNFFLATINNEEENLNKIQGTKFVTEKCAESKMATEKIMKNLVEQETKTINITRRTLQKVLDREIFSGSDIGRILSYLTEEGFKKEIINQLEKQIAPYNNTLIDKLKVCYAKQIIFLDEFINWNIQLMELYPELNSNAKLENIIGCYTNDKPISSILMKSSNLSEKYPEAATKIYLKMMKGETGSMNVGLKSGKIALFKFNKTINTALPSLASYDFIKKMEIEKIKYLKITNYNQFIKSCLNEAQSQRNILAEGLKNIKVEDYDTKEEYYTKKLKIHAIGCLEKCPMCGRFCDLDIIEHIEHKNKDIKHECSLGHFVRGYIGNHLDDMVATVKTCEEMMPKDKVRYIGKDILWSEFIKVIPDWNFVEILNLKINEEKKIELQRRNEAAKQVWNRIGAIICKEKGLVFLKSDEFLKHINQNAQHTYFIVGLDSSSKFYFKNV